MQGSTLLTCVNALKLMGKPESHDEWSMATDLTYCDSTYCHYLCSGNEMNAIFEPCLMINSSSDVCLVKAETQGHSVTNNAFEGKGKYCISTTIPPCLSVSSEDTIETSKLLQY